MAPARSLDGPRVLVVEDDAAQALLVREALAGSGFADVRVVGTADDAVGTLHRWRPDLLLLDLGLPDRDGLTVLEQLGRSDELGVPVLVVTAESDPERRVRALELGATDLVTKPFHLLELGVRARRALHAHDRRVASEVLTRSLAAELTGVTAELELHHSLAVDLLLSALSLRSPTLGERARRVGRSVHQLAVAVRLDDVAAPLGQGARCHEIGALTLSDHDLAALVDDDPAAGERCAVAGAMILTDRHLLGAAAAQFRAPGASFDRQVQRIAAQLTAVAHVFHVGAGGALDAERGVEALHVARRGWLDPDLVAAFVELCVPAGATTD